MTRKNNRPELPRREFLKQASATGVALTAGLAGILKSRTAPAVVPADGTRPIAKWGLQVGDVVDDRAILWSRADRASRLIVEWSRDSSFARSTTLRGPHAHEVGDFTARVDLTGLPADADIFVRTYFENLDNERARSEAVTGQFHTPPSKRRDVRFLWSGDTAGQGWGINLPFGGMKIYEAMRKTRPDFFIHSGDTIYADGPMLDSVADPSTGGTWTNAFLDEVPLYSGDLDVFMLDMRSYRGPNSFNRQTQAGPDTAFIGAEQIAWLKRKLKESNATWKVIAADMPIGLLVPDGNDAQGRAQFEAIANGDGPVLGREFEIADLLRWMKREDITNTVWLTADVHYCAAHYYDPNKAVFQDFAPFWEFVSGPLNAGAFGPNTLDNTFGPQLVFQKFPPLANTSPAGGYQFFGQVDIDSRSKDMVVALKDLNGVQVFSQRINAKLPRGRSHWDWD